MEAGRELDTLVCAKVFGRYMCRSAADLPAGWQLADGETYPAYRDGSFAFTVPPYSTDIAWAWAVVEHLRQQWHETKPGEEVYWRFIDCARHGWRVETIWGHHDGDIPCESAVANTLPHAICLAALAAADWQKGETA